MDIDFDFIIKTIALLVPFLAVHYAYKLFHGPVLEIQKNEQESRKTKLGVMHEFSGLQYSRFTLVNEGSKACLVNSIEASGDGPLEVGYDQFDDKNVPVVLSYITKMFPVLHNETFLPNERGKYKVNKLVGDLTITVELYDRRKQSITLRKNESSYLLEKDFKL